MVGTVGVVIIAERRNSKVLKVNYREVQRGWVSRKIAGECRGKYDVVPISKVIESEAILIVAHADYSSLSIAVIRNNRLEILRYENVGIYYSVIDAVNENFETDNTLSMRHWNNEIEVIDGLKTTKTENIGIYECKLAEYYSRKDTLDGLSVSYEDLETKLRSFSGNVPTTLILLMCGIKDIKKILMWSGANVLGVVQKDGYSYTLELNEKSFKLIRNILLGN